ncbi:peptidylprolyl isomerase [Marinimicrobium sp. ABcell2]|uniref:peptidylprolyl isomerase n=1 Tax=Marinimicrobium sp. ABcell2 TaxID=3069751 RepID=UPI0027B6D118|nr:peptidylprolyl isomerase [Marinimicrobium sp. ABcell2]MDQ2077832.1 peptidylprolyl isomerase [Marinimicrobium sp. ABcell2]
MKSPLKVSRLITLCAALLGASFANATIVQFQTVKGDFEVNLYDLETPQTVTNFLRYVESDAYENTFFHRSVSGFIVQGGGYFYDLEADQPKPISANDPVTNEPKFSNRRGTIAMAKIGSDPNSATVQWFINLSNNQANLDVQNGGFTVFGEVMGDGMEVVDAIAKVKTMRFGGAFSDLPLRGYSQSDLEDEVPVTDEHLVMVHNIVVLDGSPDSAADLNPVPNTLISEQSDNKKSSSGSASWWFMALLMLAGFGLRKRR